ncbi:MAG: shikimate kinase AroK [Chromatiales bacterium]
MSIINVFLIGPMGAGKTAVGKQLARRLGWEFVDSDREIEDRTGVDISFIFEKEGEEGFRQRECKVIEDLTTRHNVVLATGGGAVLDSANRTVLAGRGYVVYLFASVDQQAERTRTARNRPLLNTEDPRARLEELMEVRDPLYRQVADLVLHTDGQRVTQVAEEIHRNIKDSVEPGAGSFDP